MESPNMLWQQVQDSIKKEIEENEEKIKEMTKTYLNNIRELVIDTIRSSYIDGPYNHVYVEFPDNSATRFIKNEVYRRVILTLQEAGYDVKKFQESSLIVLWKLDCNNVTLNQM